MRVEAGRHALQGVGGQNLSRVNAPRPRPAFEHTMSKFWEFGELGKTASQAFLRGGKIKSYNTWHAIRTISLISS